MTHTDLWLWGLTISQVILFVLWGVFRWALNLIAQTERREVEALRREWDMWRETQMQEWHREREAFRAEIAEIERDWQTWRGMHSSDA